VLSSRAPGPGGASRGYRYAACLRRLLGVRMDSYGGECNCAVSDQHPRICHSERSEESVGVQIGSPPRHPPPSGCLQGCVKVLLRIIICWAVYSTALTALSLGGSGRWAVGLHQHGGVNNRASVVRL